MVIAVYLAILVPKVQLALKEQLARKALPALPVPKAQLARKAQPALRVLLVHRALAVYLAILAPKAQLDLKVRPAPKVILAPKALPVPKV